MEVFFADNFSTHRRSIGSRAYTHVHELQSRFVTVGGGGGILNLRMLTSKTLSGVGNQYVRVVAGGIVSASRSRVALRAPRGR